ncbi:Putative pentatricopeptide repeat-containing protein [Dendrobium catenatum]|uniref:Pentatricopeptide repeat-containing protein n=1 Tax=Dendrobium catenatum TaxID=906689 RepID=A0A2I0W1U8_9ASPA|nr:Putative pentatricopeptide repeat-containing protein [Dendrobium catenatum]
MKGAVKQCIEVFELMEKEKLEPKEITLVFALRGYSIAGLADRGLDLMKSNYGIEYWSKNYGYMVDLYDKAGRLNSVRNPIREDAYQSIGDYKAMDNLVMSFEDFQENIENKVFDPGIVFHLTSLLSNEPRTESSFFYARGE